jgi:D,D-heptose 1,7-bisphosphate phosphatase
MKALILAGGFGTRLAHVVKDVPKPMAPVSGRPFLEYPILSLKKQGITDIILLTGYRSAQIEEHFGGGAGLGVNIRYSVETSPLGTAGAIRQAVRNFGFAPDERFVVLNGDTWFDADYSLFDKFHTGGNYTLSIALKYRDDVRRYGAVELRDSQVQGFIEKNDSLGDGFINGGVYLMSASLMRDVPDGRAVSFETGVIPRLLADKTPIGGIPFGGKFIDIGVPEDYALAGRELPLWIDNAARKIRVAFLDRDGIIIEDNRYPHRDEDLQLLPGAVRFMAGLSGAGYSLIIVTNQAGIAKGVFTEETYRGFSEKLTNLLADNGISILDTYYCPFHPEAAIEQYRRESLLRKPGPGMILEAADRHFADLSHSVMVGDKDSDRIQLPYLRSYILRSGYELDGSGEAYNSFEEMEERIIHE